MKYLFILPLRLLDIPKRLSFITCLLHLFLLYTTYIWNDSKLTELHIHNVSPMYSDHKTPQPASTQNHSQSQLPDGVQVVFKQEKLIWNLQHTLILKFTQNTVPQDKTSFQQGRQGHKSAAERKNWDCFPRQKLNMMLKFTVLKSYYYTLSPFFTVLVVNLPMAFLAASPRRR